MGYADRSIRLILAVVLAFLFYNGNISGTLGIIALVIAFVFILTSFISFCPLYSLFVINTCSIKPNDNSEKK